MSLASLKSLKVLAARLRWDTQNTQVASNNLARSGIPGQKAQRLQKFDFKHILKPSHLLKSSKLSTTHSKHLQNTSESEPYSTRAAQDRKADVSISANDIDPHTEMMEINDSATQFQQSATLYRKMIQTYKLFISPGGK